MEHQKDNQVPDSQQSTDERPEKPLETLDDVVNVNVSRDGLNATFTILADSEALASLTEQQLLDVLQNHKVTYGIDHALVKDIAQNYKKYIDKKVIIASGQRPKNGQNAYIENVFEDSSKKKPLSIDGGKVDYHNLNNISNVAKGQLLAKIVPPTTGEAGKSVLGQILPAKDGRGIRFNVGKNVVVQSETQCLYAAIDGQISMTDDNKYNVFPVYEVKGDLDLKTGNIDFVGSVNIRGSVPTGFKIKAEGDIKITGSVEGAHLEAKGSIEIRSGITGQNKGTIMAGQDVVTSFITNGNVSAGRDIIVSQSIMHSVVVAKENIICTSKKGLVVGSRVEAGKMLHCKWLGNDMGTPTYVSVGENSRLHQKYEQLQVEHRQLLEHKNKSLQTLQLLINLEEQMVRLPDDKLLLKQKVEQTITEIEKKMKLVLDEKTSLKEQLQQQNDDVCVKVEKTIYTGTHLTFGSYKKSLTADLNNVCYYVNNKEIDCKPLV